MSVSDFMATSLVTVTPETPIFDAVDLMKQHDIHRLPVLKEGRLVGLITEGIIQEAMPSKATSLSVYEVNYLLNKTTVKDVMIQEVETIAPDALLEDAISLMRTKNIGVLPVLENGELKGIITNNDIFDAFLKITGYNNGGTRVTIEITEDHKGILANLAQVLADADFSIATIVVNRIEARTIIEIQVESQAVDEIKQALTTAGYNVTNAVLTNQ
ncbi:CBS domain-containing protein [Enterococcus saccharolyticus]|uniref:CBS domain-containing protein n=1 Tax=Enterococcus saccharolyticus TaxID=41997 RepID=UPI001E2B38B2|nr:CBS domain-containing protein [Enterococcus saccharolyticus]MCD5002762.1 CBS domain-containing protein [Enterococcus saccharolyticus]